MGSEGAWLYGQKIFACDYLTISVEDWSGVRSPSRAARRLRKGHRQNIVHRTVPDPKGYLIGGAFHMHPETIREFQRQIATRAALEDKG